jgi:hypothetical protein
MDTSTDTPLNLGWALTFPNVGWINTIKVLADIFHLEGFYIWHIVMTICMFCTWIVLATLTVTAFWRGKIFMAKPEDVVEDSWRILRDEEKQPRAPASDSRYV